MADPIAAHRFSTNNYADIQASDLCGCFYCLKIFPSKEVTDYLEGSSKTALCPHCGIDSVIGNSSGYPLTAEFLKRMKDYWF